MRLFRDTKVIDNDYNDCNVIVDSNTIQGYKWRRRRTYKLIGDTYFKSDDYYSDYDFSRGSSVCLSSDQLHQLPSDANYFTPFYGLGAFALACFLLFIVWYSVRSIFGRSL